MVNVIWNVTIKVTKRFEGCWTVENGPYEREVDNPEGVSSKVCMSADTKK